MSEKSLSVVLLSAAVVCGTFFLPSAPASTPSSRAQQAPVKAAQQAPVQAQPAEFVNVAMARLDGTKLADRALQHTVAPSPRAQAYSTSMAVAAK